MATRRAMPILLCRDVRAAASFYEKIGFLPYGFWGEGDQLFCIVQRGDVSLGLNRAPDGQVDWPSDYWAAYLYVDDAHALHAELSELDLPEITEPCDQPYGCRDFDIVDSEGHRIAFGQDLITDDNLPGLANERGRG